MAFTQAQLDTLEEAIASGTLEVQYSDKKVTYRSLSDMLRVRDMLRRKLGQVSARKSSRVPRLSKGTDRCPIAGPGCYCVGSCVCGFWGECDE